MTSNEGTLDKAFRHAAQGALVEWGIAGEVDEIAQKLWEWYLETPSTQRKMADLSEPEMITTAKRKAHQLISGDVLEGNVASGKVIYSTESVRDALNQVSTNKYLLDVLPDAKRVLAARNEEQSEALRSRYEDLVVPDRGSAAEAVLKRAVKALTDEVNIFYLTSDDTGIGRREPSAPNARRHSGSYSDPTSGIALMLIGNPDERSAFYDPPDDWDFDLTNRVYEEAGPDEPPNIMDSAFNGMPRSELYRAQVFPELYPHEKPMRLENWPTQDLEEYCGGFYCEP